MGSERPGAAADLKAQATEAMNDLAGTVTRATGDVTNQAGQLLHKAGERTEALAMEGKEAGAEKMSHFAQAIHSAAEDLEETSPEIAAHVRAAADSVEGISASLRDRSLGQLVEDLTGFARRQPVAFFGVAAVAGFAVARFAMSQAPGGGAAMGSPGSGAAMGSPGGGAAMGSPGGGAAMGSPGASAAMGNSGGGAKRNPGGASVTPPGARMAPGWREGVGGEASRPATMAGATLGGAAAHRPGEAEPGSMATMPVNAPSEPRFDDREASGANRSSPPLPNERTGSPL